MVKRSRRSSCTVIIAINTIWSFSFWTHMSKHKLSAVQFALRPTLHYSVPGQHKGLTELTKSSRRRKFLWRKLKFRFLYRSRVLSHSLLFLLGCKIFLRWSLRIQHMQRRSSNKLLIFKPSILNGYLKWVRIYSSVTRSPQQQ
ncbi:hypothetical protein ES705_46869 [subsurface metagenome]